MKKSILFFILIIHSFLGFTQNNCPTPIINSIKNSVIKGSVVTLQATGCDAGLLLWYLTNPALNGQPIQMGNQFTYQIPVTYKYNTLTFYATCLKDTCKATASYVYITTSENTSFNTNLSPNDTTQAAQEISKIMDNASQGVITPDELITASPYTNSLGSYGDVGLSLAKGLVQQEIPLFEIKSGNFTLPIFLSFSSNGIKNQDKPGWLGHGFVLNAGGMTSRTVKGGADFMQTRTYPYLNQNTANYPTIYKTDAVWNNIGSAHTYDTDVAQYFFRCWSPQAIDRSPDDWRYNFIRNRGSFVIGKDQQLYANDKLRFNYYVSPQTTYQRLDSLIAIDKSGRLFYFNTPEYYSSAGKMFSLAYSGSGTSYDLSAWYLGRIVSPEGSQEFKFTYGDVLYSSFFNFTEHYRNIATLSTPSCSYYDYSTSWGEYQTPLLTEIKASNHRIIFQSTNIAINEKGVIRNYKILSKIALLNLNNDTLKVYQFTYDNNPKILLKQVIEYGYKNGVKETKPPHTFLYHIPSDVLNGIVDLNDVYSKGQSSMNGTVGVDSWGYYNGVKAPHNSLIPNLATTGPNAGQTITGIGDRNPNEDYSKIGVLTKITYPTGGYTELSYEQNDYSYIENNELVAKYPIGGVRIKTIKNYTYLGAIPLQKTFEYLAETDNTLSSGVIENAPSYSYSYTHSQDANFPFFTLDYKSNQTTSSIDFSYQRVKEIADDGSSTTHYFTTSLDYPNQTDVGNAYLILNNTYLDPTLSTNKRFFALRDHPYLKQTPRYDYMKGLLIRKEARDVTNKLIQEEINTYTPWELYNTSIFNFQLTQLDDGVGDCGMNYDGFWFGRLANIYVGKSKLIQKKVRLYDETSNNYQVTQSNYLYDDANHEIDSEDVLDSRNRTFRTSYFYPHDFPITVYNEMVGRNIISRVIEKRSYKNGQEVAAIRFNYQDFGNFFLRNYQIKTIQKAILGNPLPTDILTDKEVEYNYNDRGNITEVMAKKGLKTSLLWGYNYTYPISKVTGLDYTNVVNQLGVNVSTLQSQTGTTLQNTLNTLQNNLSTQEGVLVENYVEEPSIGLQSKQSANNLTTYYEFDGLKRLTLIKDNQQQISDRFYYTYTTNTNVVQAPVVSVASSNLCSVVLQATGCGGIVIWNNGSTGTTITVNSQTTNAYSAICSVAGNNSVNSNILLVPALSYDLSSMDIDSPTAGCSQETNGNIILSGDGNVGGFSDSFHWVYKQMTGDFTLIVKLNAISSPNNRTGIMLRSSLTNNATDFSIFQDGNSYIGLFRRDADGGENIFSGFKQALVNATWLKLVKTGNQLYYYYSTDANPEINNAWLSDILLINGASFPQSLTLGTTFYLGLATWGTGNQSTFTNLSIN